MNTTSPRSRFIGFESLPIRVSVRVGRAQISLERLRTLEPGALVRLDRAVGAPFDLQVGELLLGHVDPVADEDRIAVKLVAGAEDEDESAR